MASRRPGAGFDGAAARTGEVEKLLAKGFEIQRNDGTLGRENAPGLESGNAEESLRLETWRAGRHWSLR
jgi:hypothetical protein